MKFTLVEVIKINITGIKQTCLLWQIRWIHEPESCRKSLKAWLWWLPLKIMFKI